MDGGTTWTSPLSGFIQSIAIDPNTPSTMYADATVGTNCPVGDRIRAPPRPTRSISRSIRATPGMLSGRCLPSMSSDAQAGPLVIDPANTSTLYLGGDTGVSKSTDSGATWTLVMPNAGINAIAMAPNALRRRSTSTCSNRWRKARSPWPTTSRTIPPSPAES